MSKKTAMSGLVGVFMASLLSGVVQAGSQDVQVQVENAYVRMPIPGRTMSAAFMTLENTSGQAQILSSAKAEWANSIEVHTHTHENGVMRMREIESLEIPAGETVVLQPGGLHLMLFGLESPLPSQPVLSLCFKSGECQTVTADLRDMRK